MRASLTTLVYKSQRLQRFAAWIGLMNWLYEGALSRCGPWCCQCQRSHVDNHQPTVALLLGYWLLINSSQCNGSCTTRGIIVPSCWYALKVSNYSTLCLNIQYGLSSMCIRLHTQPILYSWDRQTVFAMQQKRAAFVYRYTNLAGLRAVLHSSKHRENCSALQSVYLYVCIVTVTLWCTCSSQHRHNSASYLQVGREND